MIYNRNNQLGQILSLRQKIILSWTSNSKKMNHIIAPTGKIIDSFYFSYYAFVFKYLYIIDCNSFFIIIINNNF